MKQNYNFTYFLCAFFLLIGFNFSRAQNFTDTNIYYEVTSTSPLEVKVINPNGTNGGFYTGSITIPSSVTYNSQVYAVTSIGDRAFNNCPGLTSINLPSSVTSIGPNAFAGCTSLTTVAIPSSVTSIGNFAFSDCSGLTSISIPSSVTFIGNGAFYYCTNLTSIAIPSGVTSIGESTFAYNTRLSSVTIPSSVTSIGPNAFAGCTSLTTVAIPFSVTSIGNAAFSNCSSLTTITIPSSVTSIGNTAFSNCTGLTSITLPSSINSIDGYAFFGCSNLTSFTCLSTVPPTLGSSVFGGWQSNCDLFVPSGATATYSAANQWKDFKSVSATSNLSTHETKKTGLSVYPNPAKEFAVLSNISKGADVSVFDMTGKMLYQTKATGTTLNISTVAFKNGLYMVKVDGELVKLFVSK